MLFNSLEFLTVFLPIVFGVFLWLKKIEIEPGVLKWFLTLSSLVFYGYWSVEYSWLIVLSITVNFLLIKFLSGIPRHLFISIVLLFNLGLLGFFKYFDFFSSIFAGADLVNYAVEGFFLPLGISFFTFQQIAYAVECSSSRSNRKTPLSFGDYALFISFFPQLIAGPIVSLKVFARYLQELKYSIDFEVVCLGLLFIVAGLIKKIFFADYFATFADTGFYIVATGQSLGLLDSWISLLAFSFQIYFDFSGYCDIAIGLGYLFNYRLPINFNSPYKAKNPSDFWRRWHITLSVFLKNHIFIPLGGSRDGQVKTLSNLMIVMLIGGLWHGANLTFVIWGLYHGVLLAVYSLSQNMTDKLSFRIPLFAVVQQNFWLVVICLGWVFFRSESVEASLTMLSGLAGVNGVGLPWHYGLVFGLNPSEHLNFFTFTWVFGGGASLWAFVAGVVLVKFFPNTNQICPLIISVSEVFKGKARHFGPFFITILVGLYFMIFVKLFSGSSGEFIYFEF